MPMRAGTARFPIEHAGKLEAQLKADVSELLAKDSRVMPVAGGGFEQCDSAQAAR
jgi:hypothetical protein